MPINVLLFGLGGIGSTYALILSQAALKDKVAVHVVARSNLQHVREKGLDFDSVKFGKLQGVKFAGGECSSVEVCLRKLGLDLLPLPCLPSAHKTPEEAHAAVPEFDYIICQYRFRFALTERPLTDSLVLCCRLLESPAHRKACA